MRKLFITSTLLLLSTLQNPAKADFGDADFPIGMFDNSPKSYHDAWCKKIKNECRVRFQGPAMWVEGQGGIQRSQLIGYRYDEEDRNFYNYITYYSKNGREKHALFLFNNNNAQSEFLRAIAKWMRQDPRPIPNYRLPASQGPQETHGRDKGLNPYDNPPVTDWKEKTTDEEPIPKSLDCERVPVKLTCR